MVLVEVDEAEEEGGAEADGVGGGLVWAVGGERGVVTVDDDDRSLGEEGGHGGGLVGVDADGDEAMPVFAGGGGAGAIFEEARGGEGDAFDDGGGRDFGLLDGDGRGDEGDGLGGVCGWGSGGGEMEGEDLLDGEFLCGEDAVEAFEGEGSFAIEEVGDVGLLEAGLLGKTSSGEGTGFDAADEFQPQEFLEVGEVHLWQTRVSLS